MNETCNYIENFYDLAEVKEPNNVFCIRNSPKKNKEPIVKKTEDVDYFDPDNAAIILDEQLRNEIMHRETAKKYINIRQVTIIVIIILQQANINTYF